ncbi:putative 2,3-dehydroadipyl-CoA hydratase [Nitrospira tepida]|uniref:2,3-dehydroadipyl-CoA hydratase n=1 Tax=Nitrospira tepida TaxID=2973512 RepID=A0AA86MVT6_9BACT|nr:enoyl-CoA hydratase [Nitrospira tepida]CAI4029936.1 putative 2,3-dehydroadipyl-CoA hydratase [Nitrospira tepida]
MTTTTGSMVSCKIEDRVATLAINHPPANTLTESVMDELETAFEALGKDEAVKAVVLTGAGRFFVAGADIRQLAAIPSSQEGERMALRGQAILDKIEAFDKPVIAAINGACLGGGLELAMCCHMRLASEGATLGQPEINLGIMPGFGGTQRLPRLIGRSKATELILTGNVVSAQEAKALGLVSQVVPPDDLLRQTRGLARTIAAKSLVAVRTALQAIREGNDLSLRQGLALEARLFGVLCETEDRQEGLTAFLEKRQPRFKDR